ncbi:MAG: carbohydrate ABC transporter permease [Sphaerochaetaceae bacterium]|nr:carbohydrate ABC transporter permease [Sphaerochaetaceae bacterium]
MARKKISLSNIIITTFLLVYSAYVIYPLFLMVMTSLKPTMEIMKNPLALPTKPIFTGFIRIFRDANFLLYLKNSVFVTVLALTFSLTSSIFLSYALARYDGKTVNRLYFLFLAGMIIPIRLGVLFLNVMLNALGMLDSLFSLVLIYTAMSIPFSMYILTGYFRMIPREMDEAAFIDGCSSFQMIPKMIVPLLKPAIATVAIYNFLPIWNDVYFPLIFIFDSSKKTFMQYVTLFFGQYQTDWNLVFAALTFATLVSLGFYAIGSKQLVQGLTAGALKG